MREILESEIATELPGLLSDVDRHSVAIRSNGRPVAYLVSPREFEATRKVKAQRVIAALEVLRSEIAANVQKYGLDVEELERELDRHSV